MKINDVILSEYQMGNIGQPNRATQPAAPAAAPAAPKVFKPADTSFASNYDQRNRAGFVPNITTSQPGTGLSGNNTGRGLQNQNKKQKSKSDPAVLARQQELIAAGAKIKADGVMGPATRDAEKQFGAQIDTAKAQAQQGQGGPTTVTNPSQADQNAPVPVASNSMAPAPDQSGPEAPSAELDRLKQLAIGQNTLNQQASQQGAAMAQAAKEPTPAPNTNPLGVTAQAANVFGQPGAEGDKPNTQTGQATQPAQPAKDPTVAPVVKTGTGGTLTTRDGKPVTSRSDDEIAWANANPQNRYNPNGYPGPGNWDPKTGRTVSKDAQGNVVKDKGLGDKISDFFGGFGKKAPTTPAAQGDQTGGSTTGNAAFLPGAAGGAKEDVQRLRELSGIK